MPHTNCGCGSMAQVSVNLSTYSARRFQYEGRDMLAVPVVLLKETVVNGAFVAASELDPRGWNGVPVTVGHPKDGSGYISANAPEILSKWHIGTIFNAAREGDKLKGEAWIDVARAETVAPGLIATLEAGEPMDVSTGYFSERSEKVGEFNGRPYAATHHHLVPDHLALLPGEEGACNFEDGCGVRSHVAKAFQIVANALGIGKTKESAMTKDERKTALDKIAANTSIKAADAEAMDDATLALVANGLKINAEGDDDEKKKEMEAKAAKEEEEKKAAANEAKPTVLSKEDREALDYAKRVAADGRGSLVTKITANSKFKADDLAGFTIAQLEAMAENLVPAGDYSARAGAAPIIALTKDDPLKDAAPIDMGDFIRNRNKKEAA